MFAAVCDAAVYAIGENRIECVEALEEHLSNGEDNEGEEMIRIVHVTERAEETVAALIDEHGGGLEFVAPSFRPAEGAALCINVHGELDLRVKASTAHSGHPFPTCG